jgi:uncharacterized YigZ family protein
MDEYLSVAGKFQSQLKVDRSLFIGSVAPVESEDAAKDFISKMQETYRDATHNCYAYRIGMGQNPLEYYSDAGEPSGTAGRPILNAIKSKELTNIVLVVTRYFGGKKLGVRGLIEAYGGTATQVIEEAGIATRVIEKEVSLTCDYKDLDRIMYLLSKHQGRIIESDYGQRAHLKIKVRKLSLPDLAESLGAYDIGLK